MHTVASLFHTPDAALRTLADLRAAGIDPQQVSVVAHPPSAAELAHETTAPSVAADQLVDARVLALPAIGSVLVAGPIAAALGVAETTTSAGTEIESSASSLAGVLVGWGLAETEATTRGAWRWGISCSRWPRPRMRRRAASAPS